MELPRFLSGHFPDNSEKSIKRLGIPRESEAARLDDPAFP
jgi:hypothetical protein